MPTFLRRLPTLLALLLLLPLFAQAQTTITQAQTTITIDLNNLQSTIDSQLAKQDSVILKVSCEGDETKCPARKIYFTQIPKSVKIEKLKDSDRVTKEADVEERKPDASETNTNTFDFEKYLFFKLTKTREKDSLGKISYAISPNILSGQITVPTNISPGNTLHTDFEIDLTQNIPAAIESGLEDKDSVTLKVTCKGNLDQCPQRNISFVKIPKSVKIQKLDESGGIQAEVEPRGDGEAQDGKNIFSFNSEIYFKLTKTKEQDEAGAIIYKLSPYNTTSLIVVPTNTPSYPFLVKALGIIIASIIVILLIILLIRFIRKEVQGSRTQERRNPWGNVINRVEEFDLDMPKSSSDAQPPGKKSWFASLFSREKTDTQLGNTTPSSTTSDPSSTMGNLLDTTSTLPPTGEQLAASQGSEPPPPSPPAPVSYDDTKLQEAISSLRADLDRNIQALASLQNPPPRQGDGVSNSQIIALNQRLDRRRQAIADLQTQFNEINNFKTLVNGLQEKLGRMGNLKQEIEESTGNNLATSVSGINERIKEITDRFNDHLTKSRQLQIADDERLSKLLGDWLKRSYPSLDDTLSRQLSQKLAPLTPDLIADIQKQFLEIREVLISTMDVMRRKRPTIEKELQDKQTKVDNIVAELSHIKKIQLDIKSEFDFASKDSAYIEEFADKLAERLRTDLEEQTKDWRAVWQTKLDNLIKNDVLALVDLWDIHQEQAGSSDPEIEERLQALFKATNLEPLKAEIGSQWDYLLQEKISTCPGPPDMLDIIAKIVRRGFTYRPPGRDPWPRKVQVITYIT